MDGRDRELRTMLLNNFLEVSESLDFFEQKPIAARKRKKLNCERVSVTAEANAIEGGFAKGHSAEVDVSR